MSGVVYRDIFLYLNTENGAQLLICAVLFQLNVEVILKVCIFSSFFGGGFVFIVCMRERVIFKLMYRCIFFTLCNAKDKKGRELFNAALCQSCGYVMLHFY